MCPNLLGLSSQSLDEFVIMKIKFSLLAIVLISLIVSNRATIKEGTETTEATELESNKTTDAETTKTRPPTAIKELFNIFSGLAEVIKEALTAKDVKPKEKKKEPKKSNETTVEKITDEVLTKDVNATDEES